MPGEHVDKVVNDAIATLTYEEKRTKKGPDGITDVRLTPDEEKIEKAKIANSVGTTVFESIEKSTTLTPQEKQEAYCRIGKELARYELPDEGVDPNIYFRGNTMRTRFISDYMAVYAKDYSESIAKVALGELSNITIPDDPVLRNGSYFPIAGVQPKPDASPDEFPWKPETIRDLNDSQVRMAKVIIKASESNLDQLSPEAREFLKSVASPGAELGRSESVNVALSGTLLLRGAMPVITSIGDKMSDPKLEPDQEVRLKGEFLKKNSGVVQTYANKMGSEVGRITVSKPIDNIMNELRSEDIVSRSREGYGALAKGGKHIDDFARNAKLKDGMETYGPEYEKLRQLEAKLDSVKQLNKENIKQQPVMERLKIWWQGGVDKYKAKESNKIIDQIDQAKIDLHRKMDPESFGKLQQQNMRSVHGLQDTMSQNVDYAIKYLRAKGTVEGIDKDLQVRDALGRTGMDGSGLSPEERQQMLDRRDRLEKVMEENVGGHDRFMQDKAEVDRLEKNMSVRDSIGMTQKAPEKEVPKQTVQPKL